MPKRLHKKEKKQKKTKTAQDAQGEKQLKKLLPPPQEHVYELKMEKRLKRMLEKEQK
ncbi:MAG: hypothetical protein ACQXXH_06110 [Candidatus Bathyarchaeia archaeon]|jgi:hypothetical protein|nr:hypothetical protein [Candidatus Bathyarchaeota archaeon A05DMB-4]MDH7595328.1 hypothetical protein [Candidatus Bathyarchaeota archaeon]